MSWQLTDVPAILEAAALFSLFAFVPGYVFGWLLDFFDFRRATLLRQSALSIPLSITLLPIIVYWPWRFVSVTAVWCLLAAIWIAFIAIVATTARRITLGNRGAWITAIAAASLWTLVVIASLPDVRIHRPEGDRLYYSITQFDYLARVPIVAQMARQTKLPPQTPFLSHGGFVPLRYHYFWPMICGLVNRLAPAPITARHCAMAGTLWAGFALLATIALYLRFFQRVALSRIRAYAIALALLGVTGLDIIPVLQWDYKWRAFPEYFLVTVEWWNPQITGWLDAMLWVPHHVAALVAGMMVLLILWKNGPRAIVLAAVALASLAGLSIYLAMVFAAILIVWALVSAAARDFHPLKSVAAAGVLSLLLAAPFLAELRAAGLAANSHTFTLTVREFGLLRDELAIFGLIGTPIPPYGAFWRLFFLPLNYLMELGVFLIAGIVYWRRKTQRDPAANLAIIAIIVCALIATFVRLQGDDTNDIAWRSFLPAQFLLLLWTTEVFTTHWKSLSRMLRVFLIALVAIGVSSTLFDLLLLRYTPIFRDSPAIDHMAVRPVVDNHWGDHNLAMAETYAWIRGNTPATAVIQANPDNVPAFHYGLYADRRGLAMGQECGGYSGQKLDCLAIGRELRPLFSGYASVSDFTAICRKYALDVLIVESADSGWTRPNSWFWREKPVFTTPFSRVLACPVR